MTHTSSLARCEGRLAEVERADPTLAAVHLLAACAWMATLCISRAPEGVAFGVLAVVAVIRAPRTWKTYSGLMASGTFVLLLAFAEWQGLSTMWSKSRNLGIGDCVPRYAFVPLMLWPVMHRWRLLILAFAAAASLHGAIISVANISKHGWQPRSDNGVLTNEIGITGLTLAVALALLGSKPGPSGAHGLCARIAAAVACLPGMLLLGQRMPTIAAAVGFVTALVRPSQSTRRNAVIAAALVLGSLAVGLGALSATPRGRELARYVLSVAVDGTNVDALNRASNFRLPLARVAVAVWQDHPVVGAGAKSFAIEFPKRIAEAPASFGVPEDQARILTHLTCVHNAFLDEAAERGVVGFMLLVALMAACWRGAWGADAWSGTAGMLATWTIACMTQSMTVRGVPMMLLAVIVTRICAVERRS